MVLKVAMRNKFKRVVEGVHLVSARTRLRVLMREGVTDAGNVR